MKEPYQILMMCKKCRIGFDVVFYGNVEAWGQEYKIQNCPHCATTHEIIIRAIINDLSKEVL